MPGLDRQPLRLAGLSVHVNLVESCRPCLRRRRRRCDRATRLRLDSWGTSFPPDSPETIISQIGTSVSRRLPRALRFESIRILERTKPSSSHPWRPAGERTSLRKRRREVCVDHAQERRGSLRFRDGAGLGGGAPNRWSLVAVQPRPRAMAGRGERTANRRQAAGEHAAVDPQRRSAARLDPDAGVLTDPVSLAHVDLQADARIETPLEALHAKDLPANAPAQGPEWAALPATADAHDGAARAPNAEHANSRSPRQELARDPHDREGRHQRRCRHIAVLWELRAAFGRRRVLRGVEFRFVVVIITITSEGPCDGGGCGPGDGSGSGGFRRRPRGRRHHANGSCDYRLDVATPDHSHGDLLVPRSPKGVR